MTATRRDDPFRNFFAVVSATTPTKVAAPPYLDLVVPIQKWRKSRLGRPRTNVGRLTFPPTDLSDCPPLQVHGIALIKSDLLPSGPRYQPLSVAPLAHP